jgi:hypothetical protein
MMIASWNNLTRKVICFEAMAGKHVSMATKTHFCGSNTQVIARQQLRSHQS